MKRELLTISLAMFLTLPSIPRKSPLEHSELLYLQNPEHYLQSVQCVSLTATKLFTKADKFHKADKYI